MHSATWPWRQSQLDLDSPWPATTGKVQHQVDFGPGARSVESRSRSRWSYRKEILDHESLPARTCDGVSGQCTVALDLKKSVHKAAVAHIYLRRANQALGGVAPYRPQTADEQEVDQEVHIARDGGRGESQASGKPRCVEQVALTMGQHLPKTFKRFCGQAHIGQLGNVAVQAGLDEVPAKGRAVGVGSGEQAVGQSATDPQGQGIRHVEYRGGGGRGFGNVKRAKTDEFNSSGERLRRLLEQVNRGGAQDQKTSRPQAAAATAIDQAAQFAEELWCAVDLIQNDELVLELPQNEIRIDQSGPVGARFQVKVQGVAALGDLEREGGLADLSGSNQGYGGLAIQGRDDMRMGSSGNHALRIQRGVSD